MTDHDDTEVKARRQPIKTSPELRAKALELRLAGASHNVIADKLGYSKGAVSNAIKKALEELRTQDDPVEDTELARLDAMLVGLWPKARRGDVTAVDRVLRIEQQRREVLDRESDGQSREPADDPDRPTGLSEFERKLRERTAGAAASRHASGG